MAPLRDAAYVDQSLEDGEQNADDSFSRDMDTSASLRGPTCTRDAGGTFRRPGRGEDALFTESTWFPNSFGNTAGGLYCQNDGD